MAPAELRTNVPFDHEDSSVTERSADRMSLNSDVLTERLGDEVAVLNLHTNRFFLLNSTGARLWELLQSRMDIPSIEKRLCAEFEVDPAELAAEVKQMIRLLEDEQLISSSQK